MANTWEPLTPAPPPLLDMRWVYENPRTPGEEESLKNAREMLNRSPTKFMEQMGALERAWQATEKAAREQLTAQLQAEAAKAGLMSVSEPEVVDEGTERLLALGDKILAEIGAKPRAEDAEIAARPNAAEIGATLKHALEASLDRERLLLLRVEELERNGTAKESAQPALWERQA